MHDMHGNPLEKGDTVLVKFVVEETSNTDEFCNVYLRTAEPMFPGDRHDAYWFNAKQTAKVDGSAKAE